MTIRRNTIGRVPTLAGAWDASYVNPKTGHNGYPQKKRVTHLGSEFESLIEDNTYAPATLNQAGTQITFDTEHWLVISNGTDAYLLQNTVNEKLEEMDDVKDAIEAEQASQRESMATMQNTINAKQLEIGAVQTDPLPTQNSGNHMTSGDIYQTLKDSSKGFVDNVPAPDSDNLVKSGGVYDFIKRKVDVNSDNIYDGKNELANAILYNDGDGTAVEQGMTTSDFVEVKGNTTYSICEGKQIRKVCFYNADKDVPCLDFAEFVNSFTTPSGTKYIRFTFSSSYVGEVSITESVTPQPYVEFNPISGYIAGVVADIANIVKALDKKVDISSINLYQGKNEEANMMLYNSGEYGAEWPGMTTGDYVEVKPNTTYCTTQGQQIRKICFYNADKDMPCLSFAEFVGSFTTPANCVFIRFSFPSTDTGNVNITEGSTPKPYEPYNPIGGYIQELLNELSELNAEINDKVGTNFINLYKGENELANTILYNDGGYTTEQGMMTSDFIPVESSTNYSTARGVQLRKVCFYNETKDIPCIDCVQYIDRFTTPSNCKYIRFCFLDEYDSRMLLAKENYAIPYIERNPISGYMADHVIENPSFSDNLLDDRAPIMYRTFMYNDGGLLSDNEFATLDYFEVEPNMQYSCSEECGTFRKVCCFDENKNFISGSFAENVPTFTTPANTKYVRISTRMDSIEYFQLTKGTKILMYSPFNTVHGFLNNDRFTASLIEQVKKQTMKEWSELRFGMFLHWGIYSAYAGKYDGVDIDGNPIHVTTGTEWMWWTYKIPKNDYKAKVTDFSSEKWNPDQICNIAKSLGMKYIVLTMRHHEGFSLVPTKHCEWDVTQSSAASDIVMQLKKACDRHGIKFGVYISALLDWNDYGGFGQERWHNGSDPYAEAEHVAFTQQQIEYCREIYETYDPFLIWFDGGSYISQPLIVKRLFNENQAVYFPFVIHNDRASHEKGDWVESEDGYVDNPNYTGYIERCMQIAGWGYIEEYDNAGLINNMGYKLFDMIEAMGRGFNYLLNIPPKGDGSISENYLNWVARLASFFRKYTYLNGAHRLFNNCQPYWGRPVCIGNSLYMFIIEGGSSNIYLDSISTENIKGVHIYNIPSPDSRDNYEIISDDRLLIKNVPTTTDDYFVVVRVDYNSEVLYSDYNIVSDAISPMSLVIFSRKYWANIETGVRYWNKTFVIGEDSNVVGTRFKFNGTTGSKTMTFTMTSSGTNTISVTLKDETSGTEVTKSMSGGAISGVTLTSGHIYTMTINKSGSGNCTITNISIS